MVTVVQSKPRKVPNERGVSKRVEEGRIEGSGIVGPGETLVSAWPPLAIRPRSIQLQEKPLSPPARFYLDRALQPPHEQVDAGVRP
jgi:hypothetical protein